MIKTKKALLSGLSLLWCAADASIAAPLLGPASPDSTQWLFVEDGIRGTIVGQDNKSLTLTLNGVDLTITAFTDRPNRLAVDLKAQTFYDLWSNAFASDPPNATLVYRRAGDPRLRNLVLELKSPTYDAKKRVVSFNASVIHEVITGTDLITPEAKVLVPKTFGSASLLIDNLSLGSTCSGGRGGNGGYNGC